MNFLTSKNIIEKAQSQFDLTIKYTNALYVTPSEIQPTLNEFRDLLSHGQIKSKAWLLEKVIKYIPKKNITKIVLVGAWYGLLAYFFNKFYDQKITIELVDKDFRCNEFNKIAFADFPQFQYVTEDMYEYKYFENSLIINTACEHIESLKNWIALCPPNNYLVLQSNNLFHCVDHINCVQTLSEFETMTNLSRNKILYSGEIDINEFKRFMIIAKI